MSQKKSAVEARAARAGAMAAIFAVAIGLSRAALAWGTDDQAMTDEIAQMLNVTSGSTVAEIGAGHGDMAIRMARKVGPSGRVYATEIDPKRLAEIRQKVQDAGLNNVTVIEATPTDSGLPQGCCEAAYMIGVYHHVTDPSATDASIFRALKPGGRLLVNDFPPTMWLALFKVKDVPPNRGGHGVPDAVMIDELKGAGFSEVNEIRPWHPGFFIRDNYCVVFAKPR
jgi:predicted methyltransferase